MSLALYKSFPHLITNIIFFKNLKNYVLILSQIIRNLHLSVGNHTIENVLWMSIMFVWFYEKKKHKKTTKKLGFGYIYQADKPATEDCSTFMPSLHKILVYMSRLMGKPTICICENKGADQLLCFCYTG